MKILREYLANSAHHFCEFCPNSAHFFKPIFHFEIISGIPIWLCLQH